jgi:hypothetical protein
MAAREQEAGISGWAIGYRNEAQAYRDGTDSQTKMECRAKGFNQWW